MRKALLLARREIIEQYTDRGAVFRALLLTALPIVFVVANRGAAGTRGSDLILLIYREEVYDRNTTKKGVAEIDLVKHRNGEIGTFLLTFQGQFTRFANYASDSYAEGVLR